MGRNNEYNELFESDSILDDDQDDQEPELELGPEDWHDWNSEHVLNMWMSLRQYLEDNHLQHTDRKSTRLNSSHVSESRMPSSA